MYWPDYEPAKKRRGWRVTLIVLLGLLAGVIFAVFAGLLPTEGSLDPWDRTPVEDDGRSETTAGAVDPPVRTPEPTSAGLSLTGARLAPDFILRDLYDVSLYRRLLAYRGRPVILNFWASWCVPCKEEMPALQRAYEKYRGQGLVVLGLNQTFVDDLDAARAFVDALILTFPNFRDDTGNISEGLYQVIGLPTSVFITPNGEIAHRQIGQMTERQIETFSQQLVTGQAIGR